MRTTLDIDSDVLQAARELARHQKKTIGSVLSELARQALVVGRDGNRTSEPEIFYGFRPFPKGGNVVTNDIIDRLRPDDAY
ncbi:MAG: type II toxin-antitoxin system VapB family antitoxin [Nitrospirae bacterium]|jgi:hypothetical protein|nr:type II toxin-antitoxin system VapB family antitoxin [Nitrospirota bacterium]